MLALLEEAARRGLRIDLPGSEPPRPLSFRQFVDRVNPRYRWYRHCEVLADVLQRVADGHLRRVMVFMPPRHGKSELVSRLFTAYWLYRFPHQWVGVCSYGAELAYTLSRAARENFGRAGGTIKDDAAAVKHWETTGGGGLWAAGVGGPITGKGWHLGVLDDPIKNAEEAASAATQSRNEDWYGSTFYTREEPDPDTGQPDGALVVVQTRWHDRDPAGWLLGQESADDEPERWHVVAFDAIKEPGDYPVPPTCTLEPDWREPGEALCPERRPLAKLRAIARRIGSYFFGALYQQRPRPREGGFFRREWFTGRFVDAPPARVDSRVRSWDKAATQDGGDWTAGVRMSRAGDSYYIEHVVRGQWSPGARDKVIRSTAEADGRAVLIWGEQEPGAAGKSDAAAFATLLAGYTARSVPATGDKATRAGPLAAQCEVGNVFIIRGPWADAFLDELCGFPTGAHDDQVDAAAGAFNQLAARPSPAAPRAAVARPAAPLPPGY